MKCYPIHSYSKTIFSVSCFLLEFILFYTISIHTVFNPFLFLHLFILCLLYLFAHLFSVVLCKICMSNQIYSERCLMVISHHLKIFARCAHAPDLLTELCIILQIVCVECMTSSCYGHHCAILTFSIAKCQY